MKRVALFLLAAVPAYCADKQPNVKPCSAGYYTVVTKDALGNLNQGADPSLRKWIDGDLYKKYPDVCYAPPSQSIHTVLFMTQVPDTFHTTRRITTSDNTQGSLNGSVTGSEGSSAQLNGTTNSTTSHTTIVPEDVDYNKYFLTLETTTTGTEWTARHRFEQNGLSRTLFGIPTNHRGSHPQQAVIEDGVKWIHDGGLNNPLQGLQ